MYQPNVPAIYQELKNKNLMSIRKVLGIGTTLSSICYIFTGIFGYVTFVMHTNKQGNCDVDAIMAG